MSDVTSTRIPSYRRHKATGQARVTLDGVTHYLGLYGSRESRTIYERLIAEWLAAGRQLAHRSQGLSVNELLMAYWRHAEKHYRKPDGSPTSELSCLRLVFKPMKRLYGRTPANDFGPVELRTVRDEMVRYGWVRKSINIHLCRLKHLFRWGGEHGFVQPEVYHRLLCVAGLQRGRSDAKESEPVRPVPEPLIDAVRSIVLPPIRAMIDVQLLTGMRPGEVIAMRGCDLDMTGRVWVYRPPSHKTAWHGHQREIYIGPKAQDVIKPYLKMDTQAYLFGPQEGMHERYRGLRANRKTPLYRSHQKHQENKKARRGRRVLNDHYSMASYRRAIERACRQAFLAPDDLARREGESKSAWWKRLTEQERERVKAWRREHRWHPHQLRHNAATRLRKEYGIESARIILGHKSLLVTEVYAEADQAQAMEVMSRVG